ncbi:MAG TPA: serine/threonine-protein kinase [Polyangiaceae bacterium]
METSQGRARDEEVSVSRSADRTAAASYRELFQIGSGGFATISVALAQGIEGFSRLVVLKVLREEIGGHPGAAKMFMDEARLLARMNHPNIVQVYDVYRRRNAIVIVMEYVDGQPLSTIRARRLKMNSTVSLELGIAILIRVLAALNYAHTLCDFGGEPHGLIHRDISPQNVMVTYDGQVKLLDFGIAKLASDQVGSEQTRAGVIKGKLTYMAPEQLIGGADHRVDIFSVGVLLWELAAQRRYWVDAPDATIVRRLLSGELPHLYDRAGLDDDLHWICSKALSRDVDQRYASAAEMQADLERYLANRGISVSQAAIGQLVCETCSDVRERVQESIRSEMSKIKSMGTSDAPLIESLRPPPAGAQSGRAGLRSKVPLLAAAGAAALLLLAAAAYFRPQAGAPPRETPNTAMEGTVRLRASAQPAGAVWYLDARRLGPDPIDIRVPKDNAGHLLLAEIDGYVSFKRAIRIEADLEISTVLAPTRSDVAQPGRSSPSSSPSPIRRAVALPRAVGNRSAVATVVATPPAEAPPQVTVENPKPRQETAPPQFGEHLKRSAVKSERERPSIEMNYPGGG